MDFLRDREHRFHALVAGTRDLDDFLFRLQSDEAPSTVIRVVRGLRMQSKERLLDEFAAAFQFPLYFGRNWDAFEECMADLQWLPATAYVLIVSDAGSLLKMEPAGSAAVFFEILDRVSREWTEGKLPDANVEQKPVPFHILLQDNASNVEDLKHALLSVVGDILLIR